MTWCQKYFYAGFITLLLAITPSAALAQVKTVVITNESKQVLLQQITLLLTEVARLQSLLQEQQAQAVLLVVNPAPKKLVLFDRSFEAVYTVNTVSPSKALGKKSSVRATDQELFDLFSAILGKKYVQDHVAEWRVFADAEADLGAFVESTAGSKWVVGVNREGYVANDDSAVRSFAELFIHEYGHMVLVGQTDFIKRYTTAFWTPADQAQQVALAKTPAANRFAAMQRYYEMAEDRFVSDYATMSLDEDLAETFVHFVFTEKPTTSSVRDQKIKAFYGVPEFVTIRDRLRTNLSGLVILN